MFINDNLVPLTGLNSGETGVVRGVEGGRGVTRRLEALGIRNGKEIKKLSSMFMRGPVTVQLGQTRISVGYGMASKIMVEVNR